MKLNLNRRLGRLSVKRSYLIAVALLFSFAYVTYQAAAVNEGISGRTLKTSKAGCNCHCPFPEESNILDVNVSSSATSFEVDQTYTIDVMINSADVLHTISGVDIAAAKGTLSAKPSSGLRLLNGELTHIAPKALPTTWSFEYKAPPFGGFDTIYATGLAANGDGHNDDQSCLDRWKHAPLFIIEIIGPPNPNALVAMSRTYIDLGTTRVGVPITDTVQICNIGTSQLTINSSQFKGGGFFLDPSSQNRTVNVGDCELNTISWLPRNPGKVSDSIIFLTDAGRVGAFVTGTAVQAQFEMVTPNLIDFGTIPVGQRSRRTFIFRNVGNDTLFLLVPPYIQGSNFYVVERSTRMEWAPGDVDSVVMEFAPTAGEGYTGKLVFQSKYPVVIPQIQLFGRGTSTPGGNTGKIEYGNVQIGSTEERCFDFVNTGNALTLKTPIVNGISFAPGAPTAGTIEPGGTGSLCAKFTPAAGVNYNGTIFLSTLNDEPLYTISLSGRGVSGSLDAPDWQHVADSKIGVAKNGFMIVRNPATSPLIVSSAKITCGDASIFRILRTSFTVPPESEMKVEVSYKPTKIGTDTACVTFASSDPASPTHTVHITGAASGPRMEIVHSDTIFFGSVRTDGSAGLQDVTICNTGGAAMQALVGVLGAGFSIDGSANIALNPSGCYDIKLRFQPSTAGPAVGTLNISAEGGTQTKVLYLVGVGVTSALAVPAEINWRSRAVYHTSDTTISITNSGTTPITISNIKLEANAAPNFRRIDVANTEFTLAGGETKTISLRFVPSAPGFFSTYLSFNTSEEAAPVRVIALSGRGVVGQLELESNILDFGDVAIGGGRNANLALHNEGTGGVEIKSAVLTGANADRFSVVAPAVPFTVGGGMSSDLEVRFSPIDFGPAEADLALVVRSDGDLADRTLTIHLNGVGVAASGVRNWVAPERYNISVRPNPARSEALLYVTMNKPQVVRVAITDLAGRTLIVLSERAVGEGEHFFRVDASTLPSGEYIARLMTAEGVIGEAKIVVAK